MLKKVCEQCPDQTGCVEHGACLLLLIAYASGGNEVEYSELAMPQTEYTDEANITETILPEFDDTDLLYEDPLEEN